jgi:hypothetical protein
MSNGKESPPPSARDLKDQISYREKYRTCSICRRQVSEHVSGPDGVRCFSCIFELAKKEGKKDG